MKKLLTLIFLMTQSTEERIDLTTSGIKDGVPRCDVTE